MSWSEHDALAWVARGVALALVLQTVELWQLRALFSERGVWRWSILRAEHATLPALLRWPFGFVLPYQPFLALLAVRAALATWMLISGSPALAPVLLFTQLAICVRFRGAFNGGSDYMSVLVLLALSFAQTPLLTRAALAYVAVQTTLSYSIAGFAKLKSAAWRDGRALRSFVELAVERHGAPRWLLDRLTTGRRSQLLALGVIAFECSFPLAWSDPRVCAAYLALGLGFHLANSVVFGLNRFFFAWAAAYPAVFFCSQLLGSSA
ncbi:MAG TPA: hypothetical protein VFG30_18775 [Polyangiales bacterium]|nr:hypothetical protein [Polyangiales bacterium]